MAYFDDKKNALDYIKMVDNIEGYDPNILIDIFKKYVKKDSKVLELGMGPGKDLDILKQTFEMTGSDFSKSFLDIYLENNNKANLLQLDAVTINTTQKFDAIYSNKVLIHLTKEELHKSLLRQLKVLNKNGIAFHSFWKGDKEEEMHGLRFVYYSGENLIKLVPQNFEILESGSYKDMEKDDSIYLALKRIN